MGIFIDAANIAPAELPADGRRQSNPPGGASHEQRENHERIAEKLRAAKGQWHVIAEDAPGNRASVARARIKSGTYKAYRPAGHFETATREDKLYVRYVGAPE